MSRTWLTQKLSYLKFTVSPTQDFLFLRLALFATMAGVPSTDEAADNMTKTCSEKHLAKISLWITEWTEISPFLGLTEAEEHEILGSAPRSVRSQKIAMLRLWKNKRGTKATYERLRQAFRECEMLDLEEKVQQLVAESSSNSSEEEGEYCSSNESTDVLMPRWERK